MPSSIVTKHKGVRCSFTESDHKYWYGDADDETSKFQNALISVSTLVHQFSNPFDATACAERVAAREGKNPDDVILEWEQKKDEACVFGTRVHETAEDCIAGRAPRNVPRDERERAYFRNAWAKASEITANWTVESEKMVFSPRLGVAGTIDLLLSKDGWFQVADWKGLSVDTPIRTTEGWKTMGTISVGDVVWDKDGNETSVIHASSVHHNPCYRITFDNGDSVVADHEHRWFITFLIENGITESRVMTTEQIARHIDSIGRNAKMRDFARIYNPSPINSFSSLDIPPYTFGMWLGDGSKSCGIITNPNQAIFDYIHEHDGFDVGPDVSGGNGRCMMRTVYGLAKKLRKIGVIGNKHIPNEYIASTRECRIELLRGFMDADGYFNKCRKQFSTSTTNPAQRDFVCELLASLGIKHSVFHIVKNLNGKKIDSWDICFKCDFNPFRNRNQDICFKGKNVRHTNRRIVSVEKVDTVPTRCIEVDSPTHTFLFGKQMIVTHNTNADIRKRPYHNMLAPFDHIPDDALHHYYLQLSMYRLVLETEGYCRGRFADGALYWITADGVELIPCEDMRAEAALMIALRHETPWFTERAKRIF